MTGLQVAVSKGCAHCLVRSAISISGAQICHFPRSHPRSWRAAVALLSRCCRAAVALLSRCCRAAVALLPRCCRAALLIVLAIRERLAGPVLARAQHGRAGRALAVGACCCSHAVLACRARKLAPCAVPRWAGAAHVAELCGTRGRDGAGGGVTPLTRAARSLRRCARLLLPRGRAGERARHELERARHELERAPRARASRQRRRRPAPRQQQARRAGSSSSARGARCC